MSYRVQALRTNRGCFIETVDGEAPVISGRVYRVELELARTLVDRLAFRAVSELPELPEPNPEPPLEDCAECKPNKRLLIPEIDDSDPEEEE